MRSLKRISVVAFALAVGAALAPSAVVPATADRPHGPPLPAGAERFLLSNRAEETYRWAFVRHRTIARSRPSYSGRALSRIEFRTPELYRNAVQVLDGVRYKNGKTWVRVRLAVLPNGTTGWVPRGALTAFNKTRKRLVISHSTLRATLYNRGRPIFRAIIGVGVPHYPTPRGDFYVREKLSGYYAPAYGPRAFGLNARSSVLTDWPGGGFIGIHGTNAPGILPGRVSHGCVRMRNDAILRLFRLMPIGTPVQIR
jgi:lipoprotein-anchoring transpeptidase ErfK/SrfK